MRVTNKSTSSVIAFDFSGVEYTIPPSSSVSVDATHAALKEKLSDAVFSDLVFSTSAISNIIYADSLNNLEGNGTSDNPFKSLQAACDYAVANFDRLERVMILIASGSKFDEDILIFDGPMLSLMGLGPWHLGDAAGTNFASTTPRNLVWDTLGYGGNPRPTLRIGVLGAGTPTSTHPAYGSCAEISGSLTIIDSEATATSHELHLNNVKLKSDLIANTASGGLSLFFDKVFFDAGIDAPVGFIWVANECEFDGLINIQDYSRFTFCEIGGGLTTVAVPAGAIPPYGFFGCDMKGVFTGPAGSIFLDAASNYYFNVRGASLAGGATRVLLHDTVIV